MQDSQQPSFEPRSSPELLVIVEAAVDARYRHTALPHPNPTIATWYLLTVFEDRLRALFNETSDEDAGSVVLQLDRLKYAVRFAMDRIRSECADRSQASLPSKVIGPLYMQTLQLLYAGFDYIAAYQLCSAAHAGSITFRETPDAIEAVLDERYCDRRYGAVEMLGHQPLGEIDHATLLYNWMRTERFQPPVLTAIAQSARVMGAQVRYQYRSDMAQGLAKCMTQPPALIPEGWKFPWGGRRETTLLINALAVRCLYHLVAVHFGAVERGLRGGGGASILLTLPKQALLRDLQEMSSLPLEVIRSFVAMLTYGSQTRTPDPAIQPLVGIGRDLVAVPCLMILSGNPERNLLSLQARLDSRKFDAMSSLFEEGMVKALVEKLAPRWPLIRANTMIKLGGQKEEIDLLVADVQSKTLLVGELRWMLQPGDPREVHQRQKACLGKVTQLRRKVDWVRAQTSDALKRAFELEGDAARDWSVHGVVVIETFGGALSPDPQLPVMPSQLFLTGMESATSLAQFAGWSQSLSWLPKEGRDFTADPGREALPGVGKDLVGLTFSVDTTRSAYATRVLQSLHDLSAQMPVTEPE